MNEDKQTKLVKRLYCSQPGRIVLSIITRPWVSRLVGLFMNSRLSTLMIRGFVADNNIDMSLYENHSYRSFNDFFVRKIRPECRPVAMDHKLLISPCDGRLSVHPIDADSVFSIKGQNYDMKQLLGNSELAAKYEGGIMLVFRLTVSDYHRYHYPDSGVKGANTRIPGILHTVNPVAAKARRIYCENTREYFEIQSDNFGDILMMQVGALLVGDICNRHRQAVVSRGQEAGYFEYGGSTVILCIEKGLAEILPEITAQANDVHELPVKMGQAVGRAI